LQSYLACGRPILASLDGYGAEIVKQSGSGLVCPAENAEELAKIARRMFACNPEERKEMGQKGRAYYEQNFERELLINRLEDIMNEVTDRKALLDQQNDKDSIKRKRCAA
jgi:glycosyltransferase involved in cell wall biosynthesis